MIIDNKNILDNDMKHINKYSRKDYTKDDVYVFEITLCNSDLDEDYEAISKDCLYKLKDLSLGSSGFLTSDIMARIFDTYIERTYISWSNSRLADEIYKLKAKAYVLKNAITEKALNQILNHPEISVGFSVKRRVCSICGSSECCKHIKGQKYIDEAGIEELCYKVLDDPTDFYEWSIVSEQQDSKSDDNKQKENKTMTTKTKLMIDGKITDVEIDENGGITIIKPEKKLDKKATGWEKVKYANTYYYDSSGLIYDIKQSICENHTINYNNANYFSNMKLAENISRMQKLQRQIFRWQAENDTPINFDTIINDDKWEITYDTKDKNLEVSGIYCYVTGFVPYFSSKEKAKECIEVFKNELLWLFTEFQCRMDGDSNK